MRALFFDTETTGLIAFKEPSVSPAQPSLVQLGALLVDIDTRKDLQSLDVIVAPQGQWTIPEGASRVHGIPTAMAEEVGICLEHAVLPFRDLLNAADFIVAHNLKYDRVIMERASAMVDLHFGQDVQDLWLPKNQFICTMMKSTGIVKKPPKNGKPSHRGEYGWPKLNEALKHFTGEDLVGAHNAMVDVIACKKVFFALLDQTDALDQFFYDEANPKQKAA